MQRAFFPNFSTTDARIDFLIKPELRQAVVFYMKHKHQHRRCLCCKQIFIPDPRSRHCQLFCSAPACKKASKALSQKYWHAKPENRSYWRGPEQVERVRAWRKAHLQYWKHWVRKR
jgi:hypothetical protein